MIPEHYDYECGYNSYRKSSELALVNSGYGRPVARHKLGPGFHDYYLLHTIKSGRGTFTCKETTYECTAGDTFVIFAGELVSYEADAQDPWEYVWVNFCGRTAEMMLRSAGVSPERPVVRGATEELYGYYERTRRSLCNVAYPSLVDMECAACLRLMIFELGRCNSVHLPDDDTIVTDAEQRVRYAENLLRMQYAQPISMDSLARSLGYHRVYFSNLFRRYIGKSPKQYLYEVRMEQAELLLSSTTLSIEQIGVSVGYADALYFSKQYQRWKGITPAAYRKKKLAK